MAKFLVLGVLLFAAEVASQVALVHSAGWTLALCKVLATGLLGILAILFMPPRWKYAMHTDPAWLWVDSVYAAKCLGTDPAYVKECLKADTRKGQLLLLAAILLIIPGPISDLAGLLLLAWLVADSWWQH